MIIEEKSLYAEEEEDDDVIVTIQQRSNKNSSLILSSTTGSTCSSPSSLSSFLLCSLGQDTANDRTTHDPQQQQAAPDGTNEEEATAACNISSFVAFQQQQDEIGGVDKNLSTSSTHQNISSSAIGGDSNGNKKREQELTSETAITIQQERALILQEIGQSLYYASFLLSCSSNDVEREEEERIKPTHSSRITSNKKRRRDLHRNADFGVTTSRDHGKRKKNIDNSHAMIGELKEDYEASVLASSPLPVASPTISSHDTNKKKKEQQSSLNRTRRKRYRAGIIITKDCLEHFSKELLLPFLFMLCMHPNHRACEGSLLPPSSSSSVWCSPHHHGKSRRGDPASVSTTKKSTPQHHGCVGGDDGERYSHHLVDKEDGDDYYDDVAFHLCSLIDSPKSYTSNNFCCSTEMVAFLLRSVFTNLQFLHDERNVNISILETITERYPESLLYTGRGGYDNGSNHNEATSTREESYNSRGSNQATSALLQRLECSRRTDDHKVPTQDLLVESPTQQHDQKEIKLIRRPHYFFTRGGGISSSSLMSSSNDNNIPDHPLHDNTAIVNDDNFLRMNLPINLVCLYSKNANLICSILKNTYCIVSQQEEGPARKQQQKKVLRQEKDDDDGKKENHDHHCNNFYDLKSSLLQFLIDDRNRGDSNNDTPAFLTSKTLDVLIFRKETPICSQVFKLLLKTKVYKERKEACNLITATPAAVETKQQQSCHHDKNTMICSSGVEYKAHEEQGNQACTLHEGISKDHLTKREKTEEEKNSDDERQELRCNDHLMQIARTRTLKNSDLFYLFEVAAIKGHTDTLSILLELEPHIIMTKNYETFFMPLQSTVMEFRYVSNKINYIHKEAYADRIAFLLREGIEYGIQHNVSTYLMGGLFAVESEIDSILSEMMLLLGSKKCWDVIRSCLSSFPAAKVPILHAAIEKFRFSTLETIMDEIPTSVSSPDDNGNYAFHIALIKGMPWSKGLKKILYAYPAAAGREVSLTSSGLFPTLAVAALEKNVGLESLYELSKHALGEGHFVDQFQ